MCLEVTAHVYATNGTVRISILCQHNKYINSIAECRAINHYAMREIEGTVIYLLLNHFLF
jgi:hypothetical protein